MNFRSAQWRKAVAAIPYCVRCGALCIPDCCHRNEGKGMGMKTHDTLTWAGCRACHVEIDQGKNLTKEERRRESDTMIVRTIQSLTAYGFFDAFADKERDTPKKRLSSSKIVPRAA